MQVMMNKFAYCIPQAIWLGVNTSGRHGLEKRNQIQRNPLKTEMAIQYSAPTPKNSNGYSQSGQCLHEPGRSALQLRRYTTSHRENQKANVSNIEVYNVAGLKLDS